MATLSSIATVNITVDVANPQTQGFGEIGILASCTASKDSTFGTNEWRTYYNMQEVSADFQSYDSAYYMAQGVFSQNPAPEKIQIGLLPRPLTSQSQTVTFASTYVSGTHPTGSFIHTNGSGSVVKATWDTDTSTTALAFANAFGALSNVTASASGNVVTWTTVKAGDVQYFAPTTNDLDVLDTTPDWGYDDQLTVLNNLSTANNKYILTDIVSEKNVEKVAPYALTNSKYYVFAPQISDPTVWGNGMTAASDLNALLANKRAILLMTKEDRRYPLDAAVVGKVAAQTPGSFNWAYQQLALVGASDYTSTEKTLILGDTIHGNYLENIAGQTFIYDGRVCSKVDKDGTFADITTGQDYFADDIQRNLLASLIALPKIPYNDQGMSIISGILRGACERAVSNKLINSGYVVYVPPVSTQATSDVAARKVKNILIAATLQGAVNSFVVAVNLSLPGS